MKKFLGAFLFVSAFISSNSSGQLCDSIVVNTYKSRVDYDPWELGFFSVDSFYQGLKTGTDLQYFRQHHWVDSYHDQYTYDSLDNLTEHITVAFDETAGWNNWLREENHYDSNSLDTLTVVQLWINNSWLNDKRHQRTFDSTSKITQRILSRWDTLSGSWFLNYRYTYGYDSIGLDTSILTEQWDSVQWNNYYYQKNIIGANNLHASEHIYYWSSWDSTWVGDSWSEFYYDTADLHIGTYHNCYGGCSGGSNLHIYYDSLNRPVSDHGEHTTMGGFYNESVNEWYYLDYPAGDSVHVLLEEERSKCSADSILLEPMIFGGTPPLHYQWTPATGLTSDTIANPLSFTDTTRTYHLLITDAAGRTDTASITMEVIRITPSTELSASNNGVSCNGNAVVLDVLVENATRYDWYYNGIYAGIFNQSPISVTAPGVYNVISRNGYYCFDTSASIIVISDSVSESSFATNASAFPVCDGSAYVVPQGASPFSYSWSTGQTTDSISDLCGGTYYFTVTDSLGCSVSDSVIIAQPPHICQVTIVFTSGIQCYGDCNVDLYAAANGIAPYTYQWSTGDTVPLLSNSCAGLYSVTVTDSLGCVSSDSVMLTQPPQLTASVIADYSNCNCIYSITANGGTSGYVFQWCNGSTAQQMINCDTGICVAYVIDANGCTLADTIVMNPPPPLSITMQATGTSCTGCFDGTVTGNATGGVPPLSYILFPGAVTSSTGIFTFLAAGTYAVCVTDSNGCAICDSIIVVDDPTGILSAIRNGEIKFYPNPFMDETTLMISTDLLLHNPEIKIINLLGETVLSLTLTEEKTVLQRNNLAAGIYFVKLTGEKGSVVRKLIIERN